jgi:hypothetical protein
VITLNGAYCIYRLVNEEIIFRVDAHRGVRGERGPLVYKNATKPEIEVPSWQFFLKALTLP